MSEEVGIGSITIFHLSKPWKAKFAQHWSKECKALCFPGLPHSLSWIHIKPRGYYAKGPDPRAVSDQRKDRATKRKLKKVVNISQLTLRLNWTSPRGCKVYSGKARLRFLSGWLSSSFRKHFGAFWWVSKHLRFPQPVFSTYLSGEARPDSPPDSSRRIRQCRQAYTLRTSNSSHIQY